MSPLRERTRPRAPSPGGLPRRSASGRCCAPARLPWRGAGTRPTLTWASLSWSSASAVWTAELLRVSSSWLIARLSFTCSANSSWRWRSSLCARATSAWALATTRACPFTSLSASRWRASSSKSGSPRFTVWPAVTKTLATTAASGEPTEMFSVLASTRPTAATVFSKSETGGLAGGSVASRWGWVRAIENVAQNADSRPTRGRISRFMPLPPLVLRALRLAGG